MTLRAFSAIQLPHQEDPQVQQLVDTLMTLQHELENVITGFVDIAELHQEPKNPVEGMLRRADGSQWNPGKGRGLYYYEDGKWLLLRGI